MNLKEKKHSFSSVKLFEQCPYAYYLKYILRQKGDNNFFSQAGSAMHKVLELLASGNLKLDDAIKKFDELWNGVDSSEVKQSIAENAYWSYIEYLGGLTGHELDKYNVLMTEGEVRFTRNGNDFVGFIDLLLQEKDTGDLIIVDHKSHKKLLGKNGKPLKSEINTLRDYKRQLYIYSTPIIEKYNKTPSKLVWNHFKSGDLTVVPFDWDEYREAWDWATELIDRIMSEEFFENKEDYFFCKNICNYRHDCEYLEEE